MNVYDCFYNYNLLILAQLVYDYWFLTIRNYKIIGKERFHREYVLQESILLSNQKIIDFKLFMFIVYYVYKLCLFEQLFFIFHKFLSFA